MLSIWQSVSTDDETAKTFHPTLKQWSNEESYTLDQIFSTDKNVGYKKLKKRGLYLKKGSTNSRVSTTKVTVTCTWKYQYRFNLASIFISITDFVTILATKFYRFWTAHPKPIPPSPTTDTCYFTPGIFCRKHFGRRTYAYLVIVRIVIIKLGYSTYQTDLSHIES